MNYRGVFYLLARLLYALSLALLPPAALSWLEGGGETHAFLISSAIAAIAGVLLGRINRTRFLGFERREAFLLVGLTWLAACLVGTLPYVLIKGPGFMVDGLFESVSGFTTTGASVIDNIEAESDALILWRSLTQWFGGMGIIVLGIALLPKLAVGGMQLMDAEAPGPSSEKLTPRIARSAKLLWGAYFLLTGCALAALLLCGLSPFEAVNHAMTTVATGGFSTRNESLAAFGGAVHWVVTGFMVLAGANFALHVHLLRGRPGRMLRDSEFRFYLLLLGGAAALILADLLLHTTIDDLGLALRDTTFQVASVMTTTGFATADFDRWPDFSRAILVMLMFVGGCAGSTSGSMKVVRVLVVLKRFRADILRSIRPHGVFPVRISGQPVDGEVSNQIQTFVLLFVGFFALGTLALTLTGLDPISALSAAATSLGNVGPGLARVGPTHTMSGLPAASKLILIGLMIVGRLEMYAVLVSLYLFRKRPAGRREDMPGLSRTRRRLIG